MFIVSKGDERRNALGGEDAIISRDSEEIYSKFCEMVLLKEKMPKKKVVAFGYKEEAEPENLMPKHLNITSLEEDFFVQTFERTIEHISVHYYECQQSFQIFAQFKSFFSKSIDKEIKTFMAKKNFTVEECRNYLTMLKNYEDLLDQVPDNIYFPMFEVNCESVKAYLEDLIEDYKTKVFGKLEDNIAEQFKSISDKYNSIVSYIRRDTETPEDVEQMEKFMYTLPSTFTLTSLDMT